MTQDLQQNFCPSAWFHMQIRPNGDLGYCRWARHPAQHNIAQTQPLHFFQRGMSSFRQQHLSGRASPECGDCYDMEQHGKVSGRQRQIIKTGAWPETIDTSLRSSTFFPELIHSDLHHGDTECWPQDWQIELGNQCNSACLFCKPDYSSRLAVEHHKLGLIKTMPSANWSDDPDLVQKLCDTLRRSPKLEYLHFLGGETLVVPAFADLLDSLIQGAHTGTHLGFTTGLTVWPNKVIDMLQRFDHVHVNMSIESLSELNDYIRYPSRIDQVREILQRWIDLAHQRGWWLTVRVTPSFLSVHDLVNIYNFAWQHDLAIEACNFLQEPRFMRSTVLPMTVRHHVADHLQQWISLHEQQGQVETVYNTRNPHVARQSMLADAASYVRYLRHHDDESDLVSELARYLKIMDQNRNNTVLHYLPQYAEILRSAGY